MCIAGCSNSLDDIWLTTSPAGSLLDHNLVAREQSRCDFMMTPSCSLFVMAYWNWGETTSKNWCFVLWSTCAGAFVTSTHLENGCLHQHQYSILRKPADRLGKVVFANEVSIGGVGGGGCPGGPKSRYWVVIRVANWNFLGGMYH